VAVPHHGGGDLFECPDRRWLTTLLGAPLEVGDRIPRLLHQTWKTPDVASYPAHWQKASDSWTPSGEAAPAPGGAAWDALRVPGALPLRGRPEPRALARVVWGDDALDAAVALVDRNPWSEAASVGDGWWFRSYPFVIQRIDAVRYALLLALGGVYADLDIAKRVTRDWGAPVFAQGAVLPHTNPFGLSQDLVAAAPGHPLMARFVRRLVPYARAARVLAPFSKFMAVMFGTGPWFVSWLEYTSTVECGGRCAWRQASLLQPANYSGGAGSLVGHVEGGTWHDSESKFYWETMQSLLHGSQRERLRAVFFLLSVVVGAAVLIIACGALVARCSLFDACAATCKPRRRNLRVAADVESGPDLTEDHHHQAPADRASSPDANMRRRKLI
jgi:hypothetical protein